MSSSATQQRLAAFLMTLGPGAGVSFYVGMSGFYIERFGSRSFYITMLLCAAIPMPIVSFLQRRCDAWFDIKFSTEVMYSFRVFAMQLGLAGVVLVWMYSANVTWVVLSVGAVLGFISNAIVSSSLQMVASIDPEHIISAKMGLQVGGLVPIGVFTWHGFEPSSSDAAFRMVLMWEVGICLVAACILAYWQRTTDIFSKAYKRLAYDLSDYGETDSLNAGESLERQTSLTRALDPEAAKDGIPFWVIYWQACIFLLMAASSYLASLAGFFGSTDTAQMLSLLKLGMDLCGRFLALAIPSLPGFTEGPFHRVMAGCFVFEVGLVGLCLLKLFKSAAPEGVFLTSWCLAFALAVWSGSLLDVTSGAYVEVRDRKAVARTNQQVVTGGQVAGLLISQATSSLLASEIPMLF
jgi:hypothetical protein